MGASASHNTVKRGRALGQEKRGRALGQEIQPNFTPAEQLACICVRLATPDATLHESGNHYSLKGDRENRWQWHAEILLPLGLTRYIYIHGALFRTTELTD